MPCKALMVLVLVLAFAGLSSGAHAAELDVEVSRSHGVYVFTTTCPQECGPANVTLRLTRRDMSPVYTKIEGGGRDIVTQYSVRCDGPRGVSWLMRADGDDGDHTTSGFFRMPKCGPWKLDYGMTAHDAALDAKRLTRRAVRDEGYHYDATCHTLRVGLYDCTTEYLVGDNYCQRRHRLRYERRSGDEGTRRHVKLRGSRCQTEYPRTVYRP